MFSDISFGFATQMLELAHRLPVDLRLSTAGPRSGLRPGNTDQPGCKFIQELESGGGLEYLIFHPTHYRTGALFPANFFHLARSNSPEHLLLLILLKTLQCWRFCSLLFFSRMSSSTLQPFSALQCKRSRMEDGWLKDGISFWLEAVFAVFP